MIQTLRDFFGCTRNEARGFLALGTALMLSLCSAMYFQPDQTANQEQLARDRAMLDSLLAILQPVVDTAKQEKTFYPRTGATNWATAKYPPRSNWGSASTANYGKADTSGKQPFVQKYPKKQPKAFNLATADTTALMQLRGVGSKTAIRIVKFRDKLGGFHSLAQLNEVFGLPEETLAEILRYATLPNPKVRGLAINTLEADSLAQHPYFGKKYAYLLCNYRAKHGAFRQASDLQKLYGVDEAWIQKVLPYLSFD